MGETPPDLGPPLEGETDAAFGASLSETAPLPALPQLYPALAPPNFEDNAPSLAPPLTPVSVDSITQSTGTGERDGSVPISPCEEKPMVTNCDTVATQNGSPMPTAEQQSIPVARETHRSDLNLEIPSVCQSGDETHDETMELESATPEGQKQSVSNSEQLTDEGMSSPSRSPPSVPDPLQLEYAWILARGGDQFYHNTLFQAMSGTPRWSYSTSEVPGISGRGPTTGRAIQRLLGRENLWDDLELGEGACYPIAAMFESERRERQLRQENEILRSHISTLQETLTGLFDATSALPASNVPSTPEPRVCASLGEQADHPLASAFSNALEALSALPEPKKRSQQISDQSELVNDLGIIHQARKSAGVSQKNPLQSKVESQMEMNHQSFFRRYLEPHRNVAIPALATTKRPASDETKIVSGEVQSSIKQMKTE